MTTASALRVALVLRDVLFVAVGILAFIDTPPSVQEIGVYGLLSKVWALMLGAGGLTSLYGALRDQRTAEAIGGSFVGGGFAVWGIAALTLPHPTLTSVTVGLVFLAFTIGQFILLSLSVQRPRALPR